MARKYLNKTEKWLRSQRGTRMGYLLPTITEYRKMPAKMKREYTQIMQDYTRKARVNTYKNRALFKAFKMIDNNNEYVSTDKRLRAKNLYQRVIDRKNEIEDRRYEKGIKLPDYKSKNSSDKAIRENLKLSAIAQAFNSIPKNEFGFDNSDVRSFSSYLVIGSDHTDEGYQVVQDENVLIRGKPKFVGRFTGDSENVQAQLDRYNQAQKDQRKRYIYENKAKFKNSNSYDASKLFGGR